MNLASIAGIVGSQFDPLYSMTKGGVTLFTKSTALSFCRKGWKIRVNSIHPGVIDTDMGAQTFVSRARQTGSNDAGVFIKNVPVFHEGRFRAMPRYSMKGIPDITLIHPTSGRFTGIEVKKGTGRLFSRSGGI